MAATLSFGRATANSQRGVASMLFMVIETFKDNNMLPVYQHLEQHGRGIPEGLRYVDSWVEPSFARCFQLMECSDLRAMQSWVLHWQGTGATFEIVPVLQGAETRALVEPYLGHFHTAEPAV